MKGCIWFVERVDRTSGDIKLSTFRDTRANARDCAVWLNTAPETVSLRAGRHYRIRRYVRTTHKTGRHQAGVWFVEVENKVGAIVPLQPFDSRDKARMIRQAFEKRNKGSALKYRVVRYVRTEGR